MSYVGQHSNNFTELKAVSHFTVPVFGITASVLGKTGPDLVVTAPI
jgi:hypothetical protein